MEHIKDAIAGVIRSIAQKQGGETQDTFDLFWKNLTKREKPHAKCSGFRNGVLTVDVDSSAWLFQFSLKKEELINRLGIKDIRFRIGEVK